MLALVELDSINSGIVEVKKRESERVKEREMGKVNGKVNEEEV